MSKVADNPRINETTGSRRAGETVGNATIAPANRAPANRVPMDRKGKPTSRVETLNVVTPGVTIATRVAPTATDQPRAGGAARTNWLPGGGTTAGDAPVTNSPASAKWI